MARQLEQAEIRKLLEHISTKRHAIRDKAIFLLCLNSGMTMKEIANLQLCQVLTSSGLVADQIRLNTAQTRAGKKRTVYVHKQAQLAIKRYLCKRFNCKDLAPILLTDTARPLFVNQKSSSRGFSPNTLAGHLFKLMAEAGIHDASSYSLHKSYSIMVAERALSSRMLKTLEDCSQLTSIANQIASNPAALRLALGV